MTRGLYFNQPGFVEVCVDWDVMNPGFESGVEKLKPFVSNVEYQRVAHEQVL